VLKDIWADRDRMRGGAILTQLHAAANGEDKEWMKKHFLTTICHGDVWTEFDTPDDTENALMRGLNITTGHEFQLQMIPKYQPAAIQASHSHPRYAHKTHYRIGFTEKGITIDRIKSLPDVMTVLTETVRGAFSYNVEHLSALTLSLCNFTAVAEIGVGTPRRE
jgi:hypothetical protein